MVFIFFGINLLNQNVKYNNKIAISVASSYASQGLYVFNLFQNKTIAPFFLKAFLYIQAQVICNLISSPPKYLDLHLIGF